MAEEQLITGINVTHGGAPDGQELPGLIETTQKNGIKVTEVIGDMAYVSDDDSPPNRRKEWGIKRNPRIAESRLKRTVFLECHVI